MPKANKEDAAPAVEAKTPAVTIADGTETIESQGSFLQKGAKPLKTEELPNGVVIEDY